LSIERTPEILNHNEAWSLAHYKRQHSNMARCYIELRQLAAKIPAGTFTTGDGKRLAEICQANEL